ncbi:MAG: GNAT family N-acetyltransferase [Halobacteria archaeon]|nr:GNAT family N-acetyltransferase [Halobacteria archaeon]
MEGDRDGIDMEYELLGYHTDSENPPTLSLDHRDFGYAGKFNMSRYAKVVATDTDGTVLGALAFDEDRVSPGVVRIRYIEVRKGRRGEGIGSELTRFFADEVVDDGATEYERARIAVNNPFAYDAMYEAGFEFTGEKTGMAELVLEYPAENPAGYAEGFEEFEKRDSLSDEERDFVERKK